MACGVLLGLAPLILKVKSGSSLTFTTLVRQAGHPLHLYFSMNSYELIWEGFGYLLMPLKNRSTIYSL